MNFIVNNYLRFISLVDILVQFRIDLGFYYIMQGGDNILMFFLTLLKYEGILVSRFVY